MDAIYYAHEGSVEPYYTRFWRASESATALERVEEPTVYLYGGWNGDQVIVPVAAPLVAAWLAGQGGTPPDEPGGEDDPEPPDPGEDDGGDPDPGDPGDQDGPEETSMGGLLCTVSDVRALLEIEPSDTTQDAVLARLVQAASGMIERWLDRTVVTDGEPITEVHAGGGFEVRLRVWPVVAVDNVRERWTHAGWEELSDLVETLDYYVHRERGRVLRTPPGLRWSPRPDAVRVIYTGGYAAAGVSLPFLPDLPAVFREAAALQAAELYRRRQAPGVTTSYSSVGQSGGQTPGVTLLPIVREVLHAERRV